MPRMTTKAADAAKRMLHTIPDELMTHFDDGPTTAKDVQAASMAFKKALIERAMKGEPNRQMANPGESADSTSSPSNVRNSTSGKMVLTEDGPIRIDVPRDRNGRFEPVLVRHRHLHESRR